VIGLEVHAQLRTRTKMFCACPTGFGAPPNSLTCPVCQGMPGSLPVVNREALRMAMRTALALGCRINPRHRFARKHYYYPDMPKNYQISQYEEPLAEAGALEIEVEGRARRIGIQRLHLEEDVGKLLHEGTLETAAASQVDYNRAGTPLMEIVSRPDLRSPEEAAAYLRALRDVLRYLEVCDGNMEEGSLRCDANVSLRPRGSEALGTKVEIKNMNSFRHVQHALEHELARQAEALDAGGRIVQETRLWNPETGRTAPMRSKEYAHDYRYFPEPDLPPLTVAEAELARLRAALPPLRPAVQASLVARGLSPAEAALATESRTLAAYVERAVALHGGPSSRPVTTWIFNELLRVVAADDDAAVAACPVTPERLVGLVRLVEDGTISGKIAKDVFERMLAGGEDARVIVEREGLTQVADADALGPLVDRVIAEHPRSVEDWRRGKTAAANFLLGQVMKATQGRANPTLVAELIRARLAGG
jgi:aspartyl-tRNA(Asn)/glutamyl-tRNA(Gln) amidotransferase subunit B